MSARSSFIAGVGVALAGALSLASAAQAQQPAAQRAPVSNGPADENAPDFAGPPPGITPLPVDIFTTRNFYKDQALWSDPRYFRCYSPRQLMESYRMYAPRGGYPASAPWRNCAVDYPRDKIISPYPFKTAKEHYEALLAAAKARGGPTVYTKATTPDWDGYYARPTRPRPSCPSSPPPTSAGPSRETTTRRSTTPRSTPPRSAILKASCAGGPWPRRGPISSCP